MSDEDVIKIFRGDELEIEGYEADGSFQCKDQTKADWFPPKGMRLTLDFKPGSKVEAKIELELLPNTSFRGKQAIEEATYIVKGNTLVNAKPLAFLPSLTAEEILEMTKDPKTNFVVMLHTVTFSDGVTATWTCPTRPK